MIKNIHITPAGRYRVQVKYKGKLVEGGTFIKLKDAIQKLDELNEQYPRHTHKKENNCDTSGNSIGV
jgi:hypothetical protein